MAINTEDLVAVPLLSGLPDVLKATLGALLVLLVGYIVAKAVQGILQTAMHKMGLDKHAEKVPGRRIVQSLGSPSRIIARTAYWLIMLGAISLAVSVLGIDALTNVLNTVYAYIPNVIAALAILLVAGAVSAGLVAFLGRVMGETPTGKLFQTVVPGLVMSIALFMVLDQLGIAETIVTITYAALIGAVALGSALAFGLGGREVAADMLRSAYSKGQERLGQVRSDLAVATDRSRQQVSQTKESMASDTDESPSRYGTQAQPSFGERIDPIQPRDRD